MAYKLSSSDDVMDRKLQLFNIPPTQSSVTAVNYVEYRPINPINGDSPIEFTLPNNSSQFIDIQNIRLHVRAQVLKADGSLPKYVDVNDYDSYGPVNNWIHSLWREVEILLQENNMSMSGSNYAYKSMLKTMLTWSRGKMESEGEASLFFKDKGYYGGDGMECTKPLGVGSTNPGLSQRFDYTSGGKVVDMVSKLDEDVFNINKYLINGVEVKIKLNHTKDSFRLMTDTNEQYKVNIIDVHLKVPMITVSNGILQAYNTELQERNAVYTYDRNEMKVLSLPNNVFSYTIDDIFQSKVPTRLYCVLVKNAAYQGSYTLNPFNFVHANTSYIELSVDNVPTPCRAFQPKFGSNNSESDKYIDEFLQLFSDLDHNNGLNIKRKDFKNGYTIFKFDIGYKDKLHNGETLPLFRKGNVKLDIHFKEATSESLNVILMASFPAKFEVDASRNVILY